MKRNFMKRFLEKVTQKNAAQAAVQESSGKEGEKIDPQTDATANAAERAENQAVEAPVIYDDTDTCKVLGLRRRALVRARKEKSRGRDWDAIGCHAGMTKSWIERQRKGASDVLKPIAKGDGIVTVKFVRRFANAKIAGVRLLANGNERTAWVHDATRMNIGEEFDCKWIGRNLHYIDSLNTEAY